MCKPFPVVLCGIPCAGNSTLAKKVAKILESMFGYSTSLVGSEERKNA